MLYIIKSMQNKFLNKVYNRARREFFDILNLPKKIDTSGTLILGFHGLVEKVIDPYIQQIHITTKNFRALLVEIRKTRDVISYSEFTKCIEKNHPLPDQKVVLTFDDGYESNLKLVAPILAELGLPWSIFVSTNHIDTSERLPTYIMRAAVLRTTKNLFYHPSIGTLPLITTKDKLNAIDLIRSKMKQGSLKLVNSLVFELKALLDDKEWKETNKLFNSEKILSWEQLLLLAKQGVHVGLHCHNHTILHENQIPEDINFELAKSKALLEEKIGLTCCDLAYPNGSKKDISKKAIQLAIKNNYKTAITLISGFCMNGINPMYLPRYYVSNNLKDNIKRLKRSAHDNKVFYENML